MNGAGGGPLNGSGGGPHNGAGGGLLYGAGGGPSNGSGGGPLNGAGGGPLNGADGGPLNGAGGGLLNGAGGGPLNGSGGGSQNGADGGLSQPGCRPTVRAGVDPKLADALNAIDVELLRVEQRVADIGQQLVETGASVGMRDEVAQLETTAKRLEATADGVPLGGLPDGGGDLRVQRREQVGRLGILFRRLEELLTVSLPPPAGGGLPAATCAGTWAPTAMATDRATTTSAGGADGSTPTVVAMARATTASAATGADASPVGVVRSWAAAADASQSAMHSGSVAVVAGESNATVGSHPIATLDGAAGRGPMEQIGSQGCFVITLSRRRSRSSRAV